MRGPLRAMLWELWRTSRSEVLGRLGYSIGLVLLFAEGARRTGHTDLLETGRGVVVCVASISSWLSMAWIRELDRESTGFSYRLGFARPVSTSRLVLVPIAFGTAISLMCYLLPTALFILLSGVSLPVLAPMFFSGCTSIWLTAATWSPTSLVDKIVAMLLTFALVAVLLVIYSANRGYDAPFLLAIGRPDYFQFGWQHYAGLVALTSAAICGSVISVGWQRSGGNLSLSEPVAAFVAGLFSGSSAGKPFRNRMAAQVSYEFRRCAPPVLLLGLAAPILLSLFGRLMILMYPEAANQDTIWQGEPVLWLIALLFSPGLYQLLGAHGTVGLRRVEGVWRYSAFDATRSLSNGQMVAVKLIVVAMCSIAAWSFMWIGALLYMKFGGNGEIGSRVSAGAVQLIGDVPAYWWFLALCIATMSYISLTSVMLAFGLWMPLYPRVFVGVSVFAYAHIGVAMYDKEHGWRGAGWWTAYAYLLAAGVTLACLFAMWKALRDRAISVQTMGWLIVLWSVYATATIALASKSPASDSLPAAATAIALATLLVPLAATACAPLALGAQRHRA